MEDLTSRAKTQMLDLVAAWKSATTSQKQGLVHGFFLKGLPFSEERKFFEPGNTALRALQLKWLEDHLIKNEPAENIGAPLKQFKPFWSSYVAFF